MLPELKGKLDGIASRVPVPDGSVVDLFAELETETSVAGVHDAVREAAESPRMQGVLSFTDEPVVSSDVIGNPHSSIYDASFTQVSEGPFPQGPRLVRQRMGLLQPHLRRTRPDGGVSTETRLVARWEGKMPSLRRPEARLAARWEGKMPSLPGPFAC